MSISFRKGALPLSVEIISKMPDEWLANMVNASRYFSMPEYLNDVPDITQRFTYMMNLNRKPTVLDQQQFNSFLQTNNIPNAQIMARSVHDNKNIVPPRSANQIADMFKYDDYNYIGGKYGGAVIGGGSYFKMNGGKPTEYGDKPGCDSATIIAVYNPLTAKVIDYNEFRQRVKSFSANHPKLVESIGEYNTDRGTNNASIYALVMGYNAISRHDNTRWNNVNVVIDRSALIVQK